MQYNISFFYTYIFISGDKGRTSAHIFRTIFKNFLALKTDYKKRFKIIKFIIYMGCLASSLTISLNSSMMYIRQIDKYVQARLSTWLIVYTKE